MSRRAAKWSRLDNAAKIFPPTSSKSDPKVFRFACELYEEVDPELLQRATWRALELFPHFRSTLRRGLFWYFLESSPLGPTVRQEDTPPCYPLYDPMRRGLLFSVTYYRRRISFEVYHALTDGTGALQFLRMLVYYYLTLAHAEDFPEGPPAMEYDASATQREDDSFRRHYRAVKRQLSRQRAARAYRLPGPRLPEHRLRVLEGELSAKAVIEKAREYQTTMTGLLAAVLMRSVNEEMAERDRRRPVVLTIPVNLRKYFPSESTRNFFAIINVGYRFTGPQARLEDIIEAIGSAFSSQLTQEKLSERINGLGALEHNSFIRVIPLPLKDVTLLLADRISKRGVTGALSNVGRVEMPEALHKYIRLFDVFNSTNRLQMCACSFEDRLMISATSPFVSTDVYRRFFRALAEMGLAITLHSNQPEEG